MLFGSQGGGKLLLTRSLLPASAVLSSGIDTQRPRSRAGRGWEGFHLTASGGITSTSEIISIYQNKASRLFFFDIVIGSSQEKFIILLPPMPFGFGCSNPLRLEGKWGDKALQNRTREAIFFGLNCQMCQVIKEY